MKGSTLDRGPANRSLDEVRARWPTLGDTGLTPAAGGVIAGVALAIGYGICQMNMPN
jgi:hypothetical protein